MRVLIPVLLLSLASTGCYQKMAVQPSYRPLHASDFFPDGRASRPLIAGTVARGQLYTDTLLYTGRDSDGELGKEFPFEMSEYVLDRGRQRFNVFCSVCHGLTGHGDGRVVKRGFTVPPDLIKDYSRSYKLKQPSREILLTEVAPGYIFEVITKGYGAMGSHAELIPPRDRWAIVGYVRALQFAGSPAYRKQLEKGGAK